MKFNFTTFIANHRTAEAGMITGLATLGVFTITSAVANVIIDAKKKHDEKIRHEGYFDGYMDATRYFLESLDTTIKEFAEVDSEDKDEKKEK